MFKSNGNVRTGTATSHAEGGQQSYLPEAVRVSRVEAAIGVLNVALSNTYPDVLAAETAPDVTAVSEATGIPNVPNTILEVEMRSSDPVAASNAARAADISFIQGTVQDPRWN